MDIQVIPNEGTIEVIRANFQDLHSYIVEKVLSEFNEKKSFREFSQHDVCMAWLQRLIPGCTHEEASIATRMFTTKIEYDEYLPFQRLSLKTQFLVYLAINAALPVRFRNQLTNTFNNISLSLIDRMRGTIDTFSMNDCRCAGRRMRGFLCVITRSTLMKCHWERVFDEHENRRIARRAAARNARPAPTYTIMRTPQAAQEDRPQARTKNIVVHLYL